MKKWICKVCGYTHHGNNAPESCPQCNAPQFQFYQEDEKDGCGSTMIFIIAVLAIIAVAIFSCSSSLTVDNTTVKTIDLNRYLGKWYEIARFDHSFERDMKKCTAIYSMKADGKIKVTNEGEKDGKWKISEGKVKLTEEPGLLRVSFFGPFYSDYRIMMLAPDYSYALIGSDSDDYLWILSRTPTLRKETQDRILREAKRRGYDTEKLIWVEH